MPTVCLASLSQSHFSKGFQQDTSIPFMKKEKQHKTQSRARGKRLPAVLATGEREAFFPSGTLHEVGSDLTEHFQPFCSGLWDTLSWQWECVWIHSVLALWVKPTCHWSIEKLQKHYPHKCFSFSFPPSVWADPSSMLAVTRAFSCEFCFWFCSWTSKYEENTSERADTFINC